MIVKPKNEKFWALFIDDEPFRDLHISIFGKNPSIDSLEQLAKLEYQGTKRWALKRLSAQSSLSMTLRSQLKDRKVSSSTIDRVLEECVQDGYLNDKEWIESFIRVQKRKKVGPKNIEMKLRQKGVPKEDIFIEVEEKEQIQALLETKYAKRNLADYKEKQKVINSLQRKGYSIEAILGAIGN